MSANRTADFIIALSQHPELKEKFKADPESAMKAAGLSKEARTAIHSGNTDLIYSHLGDDAPPGCFILLL